MDRLDFLRKMEFASTQIDCNDYNVNEYVDWLLDKSGYSNQEIVATLKNKIEDPFSMLLPSTQTVLKETLNNLPVLCPKCGIVTTYGLSHEVVTSQLPIDSRIHSKSRGLFGNTKVWEKTTTYKITTERVCDNCYLKYKREQKKKKINNLIWSTIGFIVIFIIIAILWALLDKIK